MIIKLPRGPVIIQQPHMFQFAKLLELSTPARAYANLPDPEKVKGGFEQVLV